MTTPSNALIEVLRRNNLSVTKARQRVFRVLEQSEPLTMHELVVATPDVDRASVYRAITLFEKIGIAQRLNIGWKYKIELTNTYQQHHHHITCINCGISTPFHEDSNLEKTLHTIANDHQFIMQNHQIELQGICKTCAEIIKTPVND